MAKELVDLEMCMHAEIPKAILVSHDGDRDKAVWLPKSQVEFEPKKRLADGTKITSVTMPEWLAIEKELV